MERAPCVDAAIVSHRGCGAELFRYVTAGSATQLSPAGECRVGVAPFGTSRVCLITWRCDLRTCRYPARRAITGLRGERLVCISLAAPSA